MAAPSSPIIRSHAPSGTRTAEGSVEGHARELAAVRVPRGAWARRTGADRAANTPEVRRRVGRTTEVFVEGHERAIAAVGVPDGAWARMMGDDGAAIAAEVKALGFRYVALDLSVADEPAGAPD